MRCASSGNLTVHLAALNPIPFGQEAEEGGQPFNEMASLFPTEWSARAGTEEGYGFVNQALPRRVVLILGVRL